MSFDSLRNYEIVVACAADEFYAMPMAVAVFSAFSNLRNEQSRLRVFILDGGIQPSTKRKVEATLKSGLESKRIELYWIIPDPRELKGIPESRGINIVSYYRLLLADALPNDLDKVIYLDSDMTVLGDLQDLWNIDPGENYVLAVTNGNTIAATTLDGYPGIDSDAKYFNAGLLVVNLKKWRTDGLKTRFFKFIQENREIIKQHDQDVLNVVCAHQWQELDPRWNQLPQVLTLFSSWEESWFDDPDTFDKVRNAPFIIHYAGSKPWRLVCEHPKKDVFEYYLDQTAWAGTRDTHWKRLTRKISVPFYKWKKRLRQ